MNQKVIIKEIRDYLLKHKNEELVEKYSRYFKEGYDSYGISTELFNALQKSIFEKYLAKMSLEEIFLLGDELFASGKYEEGSLAICTLSALRSDLVRSSRKKAAQDGQLLSEFDRQVFSKLKSWFDKWVLNWAHTDVTCSELLGKFLINKSIGLGDLKSWKTSSSKWTRRAVPVSMIALLKTEFDPDQLLKFIEDIMEDALRPVQQGLGWFLRELWKKEPEKVEIFLLKWKESAPRLIFQYATEKMDKAERERFRRSKKKLA